MRVATAAALLLLALPAVPAQAACTPNEVSFAVDERVVPGGRLRLAGEVWADEDGRIPRCIEDTPILREPVPEPEPEPTSTTPAPLVSLPPLVPVAYDQPADPATLVTVTFAKPGTPRHARRVVDRVPPYARKNMDLGWYAYQVVAEVTVPVDIAPGRWLVGAYQVKGVDYGQREVEVVPTLAATGAATAGLLRLGLLSLLAGTAALVAGRRRA